MNMGVAETCLRFLSEKNWIELNKVLRNDIKCLELTLDARFSIFQTVLVSEIKRYEDEGSEDLFIVLAQIFELNQNSKSSFILSQECIYQVAEYLFDKHPSEKYANFLSENPDAIAFLEKVSSEKNNEINNSILSANLNIRKGNSGELIFSKSIFNSPQERELYLAAKRIVSSEILLPNIALSTIIDSKVTQFLDQKTIDFFYKSTLDLCIVNEQNFEPIFFLELDSSWHDKPRQIERDVMKDDIFLKAGLTLHRLRKKQHRPMIEVFELYMNENYFSKNVA